MRNLFRRTSFVFWQYPILWLPVAIVDPIVFCLNLLDRKLTHAMILTMVTKHSVLGNAPEPIVPSAFQTLKIVLLTKPIDWGTHLVALCLYVSAMVTILVCISAICSEQKLSLRRIFFKLRQSITSLIFFSLKLLVAIGVATIPLFFFTAVFVAKNGTRYISIQLFGFIVATLAFSAIAYFAAPPAIKLLRTHDFEMTTPETTRQAGLSAVLAVVACSTLYFIAIQIKPTFISTSTNWSGDLIYEAAASLISATPYTVLFIALSLLAKDDVPATELLTAEPDLL
jgi:hypothetical protein